MNNEKELKRSLNKSKLQLATLQKTKFKKTTTISKYERRQQDKQEEWKLMQILIQSYDKLIKLQNGKISWTNLGQIIMKSPKTAKKYYELIMNNQKLIHKNKGNKPWNKTSAHIYETYINEIDSLIQKCKKHHGQIIPLNLIDLVEYANEKIPIKNQRSYKTIYQWFRNYKKYTTKYSTQKRQTILKKIERIKHQMKWK